MGMTDEFLVRDNGEDGPNTTNPEVHTPIRMARKRSRRGGAGVALSVATGRSTDCCRLGSSGRGCQMPLLGMQTSSHKNGGRKDGWCAMVLTQSCVAFYFLSWGAFQTACRETLSTAKRLCWTHHKGGSRAPPAECRCFVMRFERRGLRTWTSAMCARLPKFLSWCLIHE